MKTENGVKKVDYKVKGKKRCTDCGMLLKQNSEVKGHTKCYVCFKVSKGKKIANIYEVVNGCKTNKVVGTRDFVKEQKANIRKYRNN